MPSDICLLLDKYRISIIIGLCILSLVFIMFGHKYRDQVQLVLKQELVKFPNASLDWWSISHFMLFGIFGFLVPEYPLTFFSLGVGFELVEDYLSSNKTTMLCDCVKSNGEGFWCNGYQDGYWYMNPTDPWVNLTCYIVGSAIRTVLVN